MNDFITGEELRRQSSMGWVKAYLWATVVHGIQPVEHLKTCAAAAYTFLMDGGTLDGAKEDLSQWAKAYPLDKPVSERVLFPKKGPNMLTLESLAARVDAIEKALGLDPDTATVGAPVKPRPPNDQETNSIMERLSVLEMAVLALQSSRRMPMEYARREPVPAVGWMQSFSATRQSPERVPERGSDPVVCSTGSMPIRG